MSNALLKLIKFGIGFTLFIPLYVGGSFFFPFIFPKIWLFQLTTEIIAFLYVVLALIDHRFRPKYNLVFYSLIFLTAVLIITGFTGVDAFRSFWGNTERMSGIVAWLHFAAFAVVLSAVLKTEKEWRNFFAVAAAVSVLEFFYVLVQNFGASFTWLPGSQIGTIGNTDLLGTYAIFAAFFALYLWYNNTNTRMNTNDTNKYSRYSHVNSYHSYYQWLWAAAFFLNIGTLFLASSRGALLGFGAGFAVYLAIQFWQKPPIRKIIALAVLIPIVLYGFLWLMRGTDFVKNTAQLTRIVNASFKDDTVQQRFTEWGIAFEAFKARPIFGFGPNNYLYLHNAFLNPHVYILRETNFDRAHNAYLDYASMSGAFGLIGYLFLIAVLFWIFAKNKLWVFASLTVAYAVQSFFVFDSPASYISLFLTIGFAMFVRSGFTRIEADQRGSGNFPRESAPNRHGSASTMAISIFYFIFSIFLIWQVSVKPTLANLNFAKAFSGVNSGALTPGEAFESYKNSLKYETLGATEFRNQFTQWIQAVINRFPQEKRLEVLNFGIGELEKEAENHPSVFSDMNLGFLYFLKASGLSDPAARAEFLEKSDREYTEGLKLAPKRLEVYYSRLQLALTTKNYAKGVEIIKKTTEIAPDYPKNWWFLGIAYAANGQDDMAINSINRALALWYNPVMRIAEKDGRLTYNTDDAAKISFAFAPKQEILGVANPYIKKNYFKELLLLYLGAAAEDPSDVKIHQSLALVYQKLGLENKALEELKIIDKLQNK